MTTTVVAAGKAPEVSTGRIAGAIRSLQNGTIGLGAGERSNRRPQLGTVIRSICDCAAPRQAVTSISTPYSVEQRGGQTDVSVGSTPANFAAKICITASVSFGSWI